MASTGIKVKPLLQEAQIILQDAGAVRWPLTELVGWLNAGLKEMCFLKPNVTSKTIMVDLVRGTMQTVPSDAALLIRAICNMVATVGDDEMTTYVPGRVITPVVREILDQQKPGWHMTESIPFRDDVRHIVFDQADPSVFYVYPGNTGNGRIRATFSMIPDDIEPTSGEDPDDLDAYDQTIELVQAPYRQTLLNWILSQAFAKDMQIAGSAERAQAHLQLFTTALTGRTAVEAVANVNTTNSQPNS